MAIKLAKELRAERQYMFMPLPYRYLSENWRKAVIGKFSLKFH